MAEPVVIGGTYTWVLRAFVNTEAAPSVYGPWDLSAAAATITVSFIPPTGSATHASGTATVTGARYVNLAALFAVAGTWEISWKVVVGGVVQESGKRQFEVKASGAAAA